MIRRYDNITSWNQFNGITRRKKQGGQIFVSFHKRESFIDIYGKEDVYTIYLN